MLCTNPRIIQTAIEKKACNALLLKVNQIGSVTESIEAVRMSKVIIQYQCREILIPSSTLLWFLKAVRVLSAGTERALCCILV